MLAILLKVVSLELAIKLRLFGNLRLFDTPSIEDADHCTALFF